MEDALKSGGKKLGEAILTFGKNYLSAAVVNGLKPVIIDAITELLEETKKEVGMKVEEKDDNLGDGKGAEQPDLFGMELDSVRTITTGWSYTFTSYTLYCIRVGFNKKGDFFALGSRYEVRYNVLKDMHDKFKTEFKETKVGPLPPDCLHGSYCICLERKPDMVGCEHNMKTYLHSLAKEHPTSKSIPSYYYLGDDYELQQRQFLVFQAAFAATKAELVKGAFSCDLEPFNEGEALTQLLQAVARTEVVPEVRANVFLLPGGLCSWRAYYYADMAVLTAIDSAMAVGWPKAQEAVSAGTKQVQKLIDDGAEKLVNELKPVLKKILTLVQSKLNKKDEGKEDHKEESKKKKTEVGDYISQWRFDKTAIGKKFWEALDSKDAREALEKVKDEFDKAVEETLEEKMKAGIDKLLGEKAANLEIVTLILEHVAKQAVACLKKFTTIKPLMSAALGLFDVRAQLEKDVIAGKADQKAVTAAIDKASAEMWKTFPDAGLLLFSKIDKLKATLKSEITISDEAMEPLQEMADELYRQQMKALNSLRTQFLLGLKTKLDGDALKSDEAIQAVIRTSFRDIVFSIIHILVVNSWKGIAENLTKSAIIQVQQKFEADVWPAIASGLEAIQSLIPGPVADMGLKIEPLALGVANILLEKGVNWALTKLIIKLELVLFEQAGTVLNM